MIRKQVVSILGVLQAQDWVSTRPGLASVKAGGVDEQDHHMKCLPALGVFDSDLSNPFRQIPQRTPRSNPSIAPP